MLIQLFQETLTSVYLLSQKVRPQMKILLFLAFVLNLIQCFTNSEVCCPAAVRMCLHKDANQWA